MPTSAIPITAEKLIRRDRCRRAADDAGSVDADAVAVAVELATGVEVVVPELVDEPEPLELVGVDGAELAGGAGLVVDGDCE